MEYHDLRWRRMLASFLRHRLALSGLALLSVLVMAAIMLPYFLADPNAQNLDAAYQAPSISHWFGTDDKGRDIASRMAKGAKLSLAVGLLGTAVAVAIGTLYGLVAGYAGGFLDEIMMRVIDVIYSLPYMFLVIIFMATFAKDVVSLFLALGLTSWLTMARVTRGQVMKLKTLDFVLAARALGRGHAGIILRHLLPNVLPVVTVYATLTVPSIMLQEAFLSFLGLTVKGQEHSWGRLLFEAMGEINPVAINWWLVVFPSAALGLTFLALNLVGDGLRDVLDPRTRA